MRAWRRPLLLLLLLLGGLLAAAPPDLGLDHSFRPTAQWTDELGQTHVRYDHY